MTDDHIDWLPARLPLPTGEEHVAEDPAAQLHVGPGEVRVTIPRFSMAHDVFQAVDSAKYLGVSAREWELPPDRPATFSVDLAVENIGGRRRLLPRDRVPVRGLRRRHKIYEATGTVIPERVRLGFGVWTMLPIRGGRSRSLAGQGLDAHWRGFRVRGAGAPTS